jgi:hypothetical protein
MKYAFEMGPVAMLYMPSLIKTGSDIHKVRDGGFTNTQA